MREDVGSSYVRQRDTRLAARATQTTRRTTTNVPPASPARAGHYAGLHPEDMPGEDDECADALTVADDEWSPKMPKSALRWQDTRRASEEEEPETTSRSLAGQRSRDVVLHRVPRRASTLRERETDDLPRLRPRHRLHPLVFVGLALLIMVGGYVLFTVIANWWVVTQDTWTYGYPRTYQCDAVVGHNHDSSANPTHFIALNLNGRVEVIEFPAGDASKAKIYVGPTLVGTNPTLAPVTLSFADVTGAGKLDMLIHVPGGQFVFVNTGTQFRPVEPADHVTLPNP